MSNKRTQAIIVLAIACIAVVACLVARIIWPGATTNVIIFWVLVLLGVVVLVMAGRYVWSRAMEASE